MKREFKNAIAGIKEISEMGEGLAIISTMNVVDSDGDVVMSGAFGEQIVPMIPTHSWDSMPLGKASIKESGDQALAEFKLNLETSLGKDWYKSLKFDMDNPPVRQEYSYGFSVIEESRGEFEGRQVRFLKKLKVHEISPVLVGA
ncbi:MAG: HK97 family phage prohead protease, partial [Thermodesulfobacteriota bacterium]